MRFILDAHLPPALAEGIRAAGYHCDEVRKVIAPDASDVEIASLAHELNAVVISKDIDFVELLNRGVLVNPLVWLRLPNMMARETCDAVLPLLPSIVASIEAGERIVEVR